MVQRRGKTVDIFLIWKKRHVKNNKIARLKTDKKENPITDSDILTECKRFYTELYTTSVSITSSDEIN